jgi:hypothetical protein
MNRRILLQRPQHKTTLEELEQRMVHTQVLHRYICHLSVMIAILAVVHEGKDSVNPIYGSSFHRTILRSRTSTWSRTRMKVDSYHQYPFHRNTLPWPSGSSLHRVQRTRKRFTRANKPRRESFLLDCLKVGLVDWS